jgi:hypothetical protein
MKTILQYSAAALFSTSLAQASPFGPDPGLPDTATIQSVVVLPGEHFGLDLNCVFDQSLHGVEFGIAVPKAATSSLTLDSVTYVDGLVGVPWTPTDGYRTVLDTAYNPVETQFFSYCWVNLPNNYSIPAGNATFFTYWFTASPSVMNEVIYIDSAGRASSGEGPGFSLIDSLRTSFKPIFHGGTITISGGCCDNPGDADHNGSVTIGDATFLISRIFSGGPAPFCPNEGDCDGSNTISIADVTHLIAFVFAGGSKPICPTTR